MINKKYRLLFTRPAVLFSLYLVLSARTMAGATEYQLWYAAPATVWRSQCLPIGNGSIGGMIYGGTTTEQIQFNEITLWNGGTTSGGTGYYVGFGRLYVDVTNAGTTVTNYRRDLDIGEALSHVSYTAGGINYRREYFASFPDSVVVGHFTTNTAGGVSLLVRVSPVSGLTSTAVAASGNTITLSGYENSVADLASMNFEAQVFVKNYGGTLAIQNPNIRVTSADSVDVILAAGTDFLQSSSSNWRGTAPHAKVTARITSASAKSYPTLRATHIADYQDLFNRFSLNLNDSINKGQATDVRRSAYTVDAGSDRGLEALFTQYGRYLIIASSRNSLPANLQGLWNDTITPPWRSDYHSDINVTMNYSHVEPLNLVECFTPFVNFVDAQRTVRHTRTVAQYAGVRGWVVQTETNPMGGNTWEWNNPGSAWYCNLLWDHFQFTLDTNYLRNRALPVMKEVCQFWQDHMVKSTSGVTNGKLVTPDGWSPENGPGGNASYREAGTAYDQQLIWDVFTNYSAAEGICAVDPAYRRAVDSLLALLDNGIHIGSGGDILEWPSGAVGETNHRHLSHLVGLYPGHEVSPYSNTTYSNAARQTLTNRGDGSTGWSYAWRADCWARLLDGAKAYHQFGSQIKNNVYGNLLDNCNDIFQIDGNCGGPSAVAEMLMQSHVGEIAFLPALPSAWPKGYVKGLCARGAFDVDMYWNNAQFDSAWVLSKKGTRCRIRGTGYYVYDQNRISVACSTTTSQTSFPTVSGMRYFISRLPVGVQQAARVPPSIGGMRTCEFTTVSRKIVLPSSWFGMNRSVALYDLRGKILGYYFGKKDIIDVKKDFGISRSVVLVKAEVR